MSAYAATRSNADADSCVAAEELVERARALVPVLAERQDTAIRQRQVPRETIADFHEAGFFRAVRSERWGGFGVPHATIAQVVRELAKGCPSSSWVYGVLATHSQFMSAFPESVQEEVWGQDPETLIASSLRPAVAKDVEGGIELSGDWPFSSGSRHSGWVMLGAISPTHGLHLTLVPMRDVTLLDDWHVLGLRGTGSNSVRLERVFVPHHHMVPYSVIYAPSRHNSDYPKSFWHNHPLATFTLFNFCCVAAGIAERALDLAIGQLRGDTDRSKVKIGQDSLVMRLAEAAADIEMSSKLMIDMCRELDNRWERNEPFTMPALLRQRRDICVLVLRLRDAVAKLTSLDNAWIYDTSPMQQLLRDITVAAAHRSSNPEDTMLPFAKFAIETESV